MPPTSRRVQRAAHRLADLQSARLADLPTARLLMATVASVTPGAGTDGRAVVTVTWRGGDTLAAGYDRNKTFTVGDRVHCSVIDDQLFIDYITGGFPPEQ